MSEYERGDLVRKITGDYHPEGTVLVRYGSLEGNARFVVQHACCGAQHIYAASNLASIDKLSTDRERIFREAIEAAAKVAEEWLCDNCNAWSLEPRDCCARPSWGRQREPSESAQAIRALSDHIGDANDMVSRKE